jgi:hypothetical protein
MSGHDALGVATWLAARVPVIVGPIDSNGNPIGWNGWQNAPADPTALAAWQPGLAAAVVCGHAFDVIDVDPRHGGRQSLDGLAEAGMLPRIYGQDSTPQGGLHLFIAPLGVGSRDGFAPGLDLKGGRPDGTGRGFVFIAPTWRKGGTYAWIEPPELDALADGDESGEALAELVRSLKADVGWTDDPAQRYAGPPPVGREAAYLAAMLTNLAGEVAATVEGSRNRTLFVAAMKAGSFVAGAGLDRDAAVSALRDAALRAGLGEREIMRTLASGLRIGDAHPRTVPPPSTDPPPQTDRSGRQPVCWPEFWARPKTPREVLIWPLVGRGELVRIYAQAKVGKTLLVQEGVIRYATGTDFLARQCPQGHVVYVDQENTEDDWRERMDDFGLSAETDLSRLHWYSLQDWPPLDTAEGGQALLDAVTRHGASLVVIDTQSKLTVGEEDKSTTQQAIYRHTFMPLKRAGVACIVIDHAGNDPTRPRGSSEKRDDMDAVWRLGSRGKDRLTLTCTHSRRRTEIDKLYLYRAAGPLRHQVDDPDEREEEFITRCLNAISFRPDIDLHTASTREVTTALREKGFKFRDATIRDAHKRVREMFGPGSDEPES